MVAYWLIPAETARSFFVSIISELAARFEASGMVGHRRVETIRADQHLITLTWTDNSSTEDGFKIERSVVTTGNFTQVAIVGANITTFANTGLTAQTKYYYRVRAYCLNCSESRSRRAEQFASTIMIWAIA